MALKLPFSWGTTFELDEGYTSEKFTIPPAIKWVKFRQLNESRLSRQRFWIGHLAECFFDKVLSVPLCQKLLISVKIVHVGMVWQVVQVRPQRSSIYCKTKKTCIESP